jgi:hypothetical protein
LLEARPEVHTRNGTGCGHQGQQRVDVATRHQTLGTDVVRDWRRR